MKVSCPCGNKASHSDEFMVCMNIVDVCVEIGGPYPCERVKSNYELMGNASIDKCAHCRMH